MPIHGWTRVSAGTFHHFHNAWINKISEALNDGLLPANYYAMTEQVAGPALTDVLTLQEADAGDARGAPPAGLTAPLEVDTLARKQRTLVIRHGSNDRVVALLEILSPGNKNSRH